MTIPESSSFAGLRNRVFDVVEYRVAYRDTLDDVIRYFADRIAGFDIPSDGAGGSL